MDRLPRDITQQQLHPNIARLLEEHVPLSPQPQVSQPLVPQTNDSQQVATEKEREEVEMEELGLVVGHQPLCHVGGRQWKWQVGSDESLLSRSHQDSKRRNGCL